MHVKNSKHNSKATMRYSISGMSWKSEDPHVEVTTAPKLKTRSQVVQSNTITKEFNDCSIVKSVLANIAQSEASILEEDPLREMSRIIAEVNVMDKSLKQAIEALLSVVPEHKCNMLSAKKYQGQKNLLEANMSGEPVRTIHNSIPTREQRSATTKDDIPNIVVVRRKVKCKDLASIRESPLEQACDRLYNEAISRKSNLKYSNRIHARRILNKKIHENNRRKIPVVKHRRMNIKSKSCTKATDSLNRRTVKSLQVSNYPVDRSSPKNTNAQKKSPDINSINTVTTVSTKSLNGSARTIESSSFAGSILDGNDSSCYLEKKKKSKEHPSKSKAKKDKETKRDSSNLRLDKTLSEDKRAAVFSRLYNTSKNEDRQIEGRKRREAIALESARAKEVPDFSDWTLPLSKADNAYYRSVRFVIAAEKKKAETAKTLNKSYRSRFHFNANTQQLCGDDDFVCSLHQLDIQ